MVRCAAAWLSTTIATGIGVVAGVTRTTSRARPSSVTRTSLAVRLSMGALVRASSALT